MRSNQPLRLLFFLILLGVPVFTHSVAAAQTPTLNLEGTASLAPDGSCSKDQCSGALSGSVSGLPIGASAASLNLTLFLNPRPGSPNGNCYETIGSGTLGDSYDVTITAGQICPAYDHFDLTAHVEIHTSDLCAPLWQAMTGQLNVFGQIHTAGPTPTPSKPSRPLINA
jgi:hypothetical protein